MKTVFFITIILFGTLNSVIVRSQKFVSFTGDIKILKNEKSLNIDFSYEKMKVGELKSEQEYIEKRMKEYNEKKTGKGEEWLNEWNDNKKYWENGFIEILNKVLRKNNVTVNQNQIDAKYIFYINPIFLEIGWYGVGVKQNAELDLEVLVCLSNDDKNPVARILIENAFGNTIGFTKTDKHRIGSAYESAAKKLGNFLRENVYSI